MPSSRRPLSKKPSFLALPLEIQINILSYVLVVPFPLGLHQVDKVRLHWSYPPRIIEPPPEPHHTVYFRLDFSTALIERKPPAKYRKLYNKLSPEAKLPSDFVSLGLVCRSVRALARHLFFAKNEWTLEINKAKNTVALALQNWKAAGLQMMTRITITAEEEAPGKFAPEIEKTLSRFALALKERRRSNRIQLDLIDAPMNRSNLKSLTVEWLSWSASDYYASTPRFLRNHGLELNADGTRGEQHFHPAKYGPVSNFNPRFGNSIGERTDYIKAEEMALGPLKNLRGIASPRVERCVSEEWGQWLTGCMRLEEGEDPKRFKRTVDVGAVKMTMDKDIVAAYIAYWMRRAHVHDGTSPCQPCLHLEM